MELTAVHPPLTSTNPLRAFCALLRVGAFLHGMLKIQDVAKTEPRLRAGGAYLIPSSEFECAADSNEAKHSHHYPVGH